MLEVGWRVGTASPADRDLDAGEIAIGFVEEEASLVHEVAEEQSALHHEVEEGSEFVGDGEEDLILWYGDNPPPVVIAALEQLGWRNWMIGSGVFCVGCLVLLRSLLALVWYGVFDWSFADWAVGPVVDGSSGSYILLFSSESLVQPEQVVGVVWIASVLHRLGVLLLGLRTNPLRVGVVFARGLREVRFGRRGWLFVWFLLIILLGFVESCEAQKRNPALSEVDNGPVDKERADMTPWEDGWTLGSVEAHYGLVIATPWKESGRQPDENLGLSCRNQGTGVKEVNSEGLEFLVGVGKMFLTVATWELLKWGACRSERSLRQNLHRKVLFS